MKNLLLGFVVMLFGCSLPLDTDNITGPEISYCTDTRDGEVFSFRKDKVLYGQASLNDVCIVVIDESGVERQLCKSHEIWLKCSGEK